MTDPKTNKEVKGVHLTLEVELYNEVKTKMKEDKIDSIKIQGLIKMLFSKYVKGETKI